MSIFMCACLLLTFALRLPTAGDGLDFNLEEEWELFKQRYKQGIGYWFMEHMYNYKTIFKENVREIKVHNYLHSIGLKSFALKVNKFADVAFKKKYISRNESDAEVGHAGDSSISKSPLSKGIDWRIKGYVTPVKDQGNCGSCWAFSLTGAIEGQHFRKTGRLVSLSEQNLIDCVKDRKDPFYNTCNGYYRWNGFEYVMSSGGINTEESYPYSQTMGECKFDNDTIGATITEFDDVESGNEGALLEAVAIIGPISAAIDADHPTFHHYSHGIFDEPNCSSQNLRHAVLIVGYGSENGRDYWLVKNSWGKDWGMDGYIKMSRNKNNQCGIATNPMYPLV